MDKISEYYELNHNPDVTLPMYRPSIKKLRLLYGEYELWLTNGFYSEREVTGADEVDTGQQPGIVYLATKWDTV